MKPKTLILIAAAIGCGLVASYMTSRLLAERAKEGPAEEEKVAVLVALTKVPMGTFIREPEKYFKKKEFTKSQAPAKALMEFDQVKDKRLNKPLGTDQFVTSEDLLGAKGDDVSHLLPAGMRAVTLRANLETTGGFVLPNSRVDLIVTVRNGNESWSRIIMQNMLVMAVDTMPTRQEDKNAIVPSVVTLAATPEEAEKLAMAASMGEIRFVLRPFNEDKAVSTKGATPATVAKANSQASSGVQADEADGPLPAGIASKFEFGPGGKPIHPGGPEAVEPEEPATRTHVLIIENGTELTRAVFVIDKDGKVVPRDVEKSDPAPKPERPARPEKAAPAPEPGKIELPKTEPPPHRGPRK